MTLSLKPSSSSSAAAGAARNEATREVASPPAPAETAAIDDVADGAGAAPVDLARQGAARAASLGAEAIARDRLTTPPPAASSSTDAPRRGLADEAGKLDGDGRFDAAALSMDPEVRERGRVPNRRTASGETKKNPAPKH